MLSNRKLIFLATILLIVIVLSISLQNQRVRRHIVFSYSQFLIDYKLPEFRPITPVLGSEVPLDTTSFISSLKANDLNLNSQRLIDLFHQHWSLSYKYYDFFRQIPPTYLGDPGYDLNHRVLYKTNQYFEGGLGGICLNASIFIKFQTSNQINSYLEGLSEQLSIYEDISIDAEDYILKIEPLLFIDWHWRHIGVNMDIIRSLPNFNPDNPDQFLLESRINGIFGPEIDYYDGIINDLPRIVSFAKHFTSNGKIAFAKHFGYRADYRMSKHESKLPDAHNDIIIETTPRKQFISEDMAIFRRLFDTVDNPLLGIMIGHHYINSIDSLKAAPMSEKVMSLKNTISDGITISDAMGMGGIIKTAPYEDLIRDLETDLILVSDFNLDRMNIVKSHASNESDERNNLFIERIMKLKMDMGLIHLYKK